MSDEVAIDQFIAHWRETGGSELANTQSFITGLCMSAFRAERWSRTWKSHVAFTEVLFATASNARSPQDSDDAGRRLDLEAVEIYDCTLPWRDSMGN